MTAIIQVQDLVKHYEVPVREGGLLASMRSVVRRRHRTVRAVEGISFELQPGEIVGFLGPNGAGKTTTLKVLSGLLYPTSGKVDVLGFVPSDRRVDFLSNVTLIMGQRQQLFWDLPAVDTFLVNKSIFGIDDREYAETVATLTDLLDLSELLEKPVRQLSLGERMKVELAAGLLHRPTVLYLDEPTIGLDVTMQQRIREFISEYNKSAGATVLLTSHYMADVEALAERVIVINRGSLLYDGPLQGLVDRYAPYKIITLQLDRDLTGEELARHEGLTVVDNRRVKLTASRDGIADLTVRLVQGLPVADVTVEDPPLEQVISEVFEDAEL